MQLRIRRGDVTLVNKSVFDGGRLSWGALGLLVTLCSMEEGDHVDDGWLMDNGACNAGELEELKQELRDAGYLVRLDSGDEMLVDKMPGVAE